MMSLTFGLFTQVSGSGPSCSEKIRFDISCEFSARQRIHMNIKPYFLQKIKVKKKKIS